VSKCVGNSSNDSY